MKIRGKDHGKNRRDSSTGVVRVCIVNRDDMLLCPIEMGVLAGGRGYANKERLEVYAPGAVGGFGFWPLYFPSFT